MQQITNLANEADQIAKVVLSDGSTATFEFVYRPAIQRWAYSVTHPDITLSGSILCAGPNVLRDFRNLIDFGLGCYTTDGADPFYIEDFASGRVVLYVLDSSEVQFFETAIFGSQAVAA